MEKFNEKIMEIIDETLLGKINATPWKKIE